MKTDRKLIKTILLPVRWGDMDAYGHVNNTVYFRFFEQMRVEWIEELGFKAGAQVETGPIIVSTECIFLRPVTYPATVRVEMYAGEPGRSSFMTYYALYVEGDEQLCATGNAKVVWIDTTTNKSVPFPQTLNALFEIESETI